MLEIVDGSGESDEGRDCQKCGRVGFDREDKSDQD